MKGLQNVIRHYVMVLREGLRCGPYHLERTTMKKRMYTRRRKTKIEVRRKTNLKAGELSKERNDSVEMMSENSGNDQQRSESQSYR